MAESNVHVVMTGDEARLAASQRKAAKGQEELTDSVFKSNKELDAFARSVSKIDASPADRAKEKFAKLDEALKRGKITQEQFAAATGRVQAALDKKNQAGSESQSMLSGLGTKALAAAGSYLSLTSAIQAVTAAIQEQRAVEAKTLKTQIDEAAEDAKLAQNLTGQTTQTKRQTVQALEQVTIDLGIETSGAVKAGFNEAISKAAGDVGLAMSATKAAAQLQRATPEGIPTFAAGGAVMSKLIDTKDVREAFGLMYGVQAASPIAEPKELMQELPGALAAAIAVDRRAGTKDQREATREAASLFAALGQATQQRAAPTSTATIQFAAQLEKFFAAGTKDLDEEISRLEQQAAEVETRAEKRAVEIEKGAAKAKTTEAKDEQLARAAEVRKEGSGETSKLREEAAAVRAQREAAAVADPGTLAGRVAAIQKSPALQERLLPTLTGEAKFLPAMKALLQGRDAEVTKQFQANLQQLRVDAKHFDQLAGELGAQSQVSEAIQRQAADAAMKGRAQAARMKDTKGASSAAITEQLAQGLETSSRGWIDRLSDMARRGTLGAADVKGDVQTKGQLAIRMLEARAQEIAKAPRGVADLAAGQMLTGLPLPAPMAKWLSGRDRPLEELSKEDQDRIKQIRDAQAAIRTEMERAGAVEAAPLITPSVTTGQPQDNRSVGTLPRQAGLQNQVSFGYGGITLNAGQQPDNGEVVQTLRHLEQAVVGAVAQLGKPGIRPLPALNTGDSIRREQLAEIGIG